MRTRASAEVLALVTVTLSGGVLAVVTAMLLLVAFPARAPAQDHQHHHQHVAQDFEGRHGVGHEIWHEQFYSKLRRKDNKTSCCNLTDCVPTQSRMVDDHYEVKVDGEWTPVPQDVIQNVTAPDGGAHVCFPRQPNRYYPKGTLFCVVLPPET